MRSLPSPRAAAPRSLALVLLIALLASLAGPAPRARAATFDLTLCDPNPLLNGASLVAALTTANSNGASDTILLGPCTYTLNSVNNTDDGPTGLPVIQRDGGPSAGLTIVGDGATIERAAGSPPFRFFYIDGSPFNYVPFSISGVTLRGGDPGLNDGGALVARYADLTIADSAFAANSSGGRGGAIYGVSANGSISGSTFSGNSAEEGGAIYFGADGGGSVELVNSTLSGNSAVVRGGAIVNAASLFITQATIAANGESGVVAEGDTILAGSIVAGGAGPDTEGLISSAGYNLIGVGDPAVFAATGDQVGSTAAPRDPLLAPLGANGGPTRTHALYTGSPAVDAIPAAAGCGLKPPTDQRGVARPQAAGCDIGAFEGSVSLPAAPEIAVFAGENAESGAPIADGQAAAVDFGTTSVGAPVPRTFTIRNLGGAALAISPPALPVGYELVGAFPAGPVAPNTEVSFQIRLTAAAAGTFSGTLSFANGDADESPFDFAIMGTVVAAPAQARRLFLPLLAGAPLAPDLVLTSISISPQRRSFAAGEPVVVTVVVTNRGTGPASPFWVDLYVSPSRGPRINDLWHDICGLSPCVGAAWAVDRSLGPGESVTLTTAAGFDSQRTYWTGWLPSGATSLHAYADNWNTSGTVGAVRESDETNNWLAVEGLSVSGPNPPAPPWPGAALAGDVSRPHLPARPTLP